MTSHPDAHDGYGEDRRDTRPVAGSQWDILTALDSFPRIPVTPETATLTGILTAVGAVIVALVGAVLGGMAGMRYHRRVDRVGLGGVTAAP
ncbi:hypothetical protein QSU92_07110 [Microbacterium sp. ET2]|uniref:hypothetical protein n=1 Tax=Microbacterium albipurpureum TaxID=3050384 RepID=UPI00259C8B3C|nr:hypothetical protein [Microbacterium sp. ET2 (Ac-2212)]WJL96928.1 hypothetical protein QSU92_07110 [Microbacterium sp. ET2 (Ac-2212)]